MVGDPFSFDGDNNNPDNGALGVAPSAWQHLALFGGNLAAAANARTPSGHLAYGNGFAGPFGAATVDTFQQAQRQALAQGQMGLQRQQGQRMGLENQLLRSQLPVQLARNQVIQRALTDPGYMQQLIQQQMGADGGQGYGGAPPVNNYTFAASSAPAGGGGSGNPNLTPIVHQLESGGSMKPGVVGDGGAAAGPMQVHQAALDDVNKRLGTNYTLQQLSADPGIGKLVGTTYLKMQQERFPGQPALAFSAYNGGPGATQNAVNSGQGVAGMPPSVQQYVGRGMTMLAGGAPQSAPSLPSPVEAMQRARYLEAQAAVIAQYGLPGDAPGLREQAKQYREYGLSGVRKQSEATAQNLSDLQYKPQIAAQTKAAEAPYVPIDLRPGGMHYDPIHGWIKNPNPEHVQNPDGSSSLVHVSPPMPNAPPGSAGEATSVMGPNGQPVVTKIAPEMQALRTEAIDHFSNEGKKSFIAAQGTQSWLTQMNHSADVLNANKGFLGTGPTAPERLAFAANVNDIFRTTGLTPPFDESKIASWEELTKATTTAGFELSSHYEGHARQAASTIMNATSAVPSIKNSPIGFQTVSAGINEAAQQNIDLHNYQQSILENGKPGDKVSASDLLAKSDVEFYKQNPAQAYARRAISNVTPYKIMSTDKAAADKEMLRYLPGTRITLPNGKQTEVPERPGAPPIPDYMKPQPNG